jgi:hypothetical protein
MCGDEDDLVDDVHEPALHAGLRYRLRVEAA